MSKVAVLIPCFNEVPTIAKVVADYKTLLPDATIYVFDNNSTDQSAQIARESGAMLHTVHRQGKGFVMAEMFRTVDADVYLIVDGDDTYNAKDVAALITPVLEGRADMAIGERLSGTYFTENKRRFHNLGNRLVRFLVNLIFRSNIHDILTGARALSRNFVRSFPIMSRGFEIETEMTIHALDKKMSITQQPVEYRDRPSGSVSKLNTFSDGTRVLKTIFTLFRDYRPMSFFGWCSVLFLLVSIGLFIPVFATYLQTGLVPKIPTLITSVGFAMIAMVSFACGIILDTIKKYSDRTCLLLLNLNHPR